MTVAELLQKLITNALKDRQFYPHYQDRTDGMDYIIKAKEKRDGLAKKDIRMV